MATDSNRRIVWKWESDAFGSTVPQQDPDGDGKQTIVNLRFPGQYYDAESGLHQNWHRTYDPSLGRYISSDPIGLVGGLNTYGYVGQSPLVYRDRSGLDAETLAGVTAIPTALEVCSANPAVCGLGLSGVTGWAAGTLIYPHIAEPLGDIIDKVCSISGDSFDTDNPKTSNPLTGEPGSCSTCNNTKGKKNKSVFMEKMVNLLSI
ncbi:MAG: RHS repeat-associated core domain-containing protein [Candidatus Thiothrix singaporensis]|uniref:RHS repeat-associated core domain-containing protein n=1 Tax=Candidatus Thiothrix singaporensis TaxID=2799669 RepID=A0A7L6AWL2_9GAMM|nr:MAG: RHS repeat-associated core domain-containing protein [Candidatus Thiothrix singaporensis]